MRHLWTFWPTVVTGCLVLVTGCVKVSPNTRRAGISGPAVPVAVSGPIDLRGAEPRPGSAGRVRQRAVMTNGRIRVTAAGVTETGSVDSTFESETESDVLAVGGGRITHLREKVVSETERRSIRVGGETTTDERPSPLTGETVDYRKAGGGWAITLVGKPPTPEQAEELKGYPPPSLYRELLPARPVAVGESWEVPPAELRRLLGARVRVDSGRWTMTFTRVVVVNGERCAEIAEDVEVRGEMDVTGGKSRGWFRLTGTTTWALGNGRTFTSRHEGQVEETAELIDNGVRVTTTTAGPVRIECSHEDR
jgi:hypothetical protein